MGLDKVGFLAEVMWAAYRFEGIASFVGSELFQASGLVARLALGTCRC